MGSGTYYAVGWGCRELPEMSEACRGKLSDIFEEHNIKTSYESSTKYAVVELLNSLNDRHGRGHCIPSGVMPVGDLASAIKKHCEALLRAAKDTWGTVHAKAVNIGVVLPQPELLWYADYD